VQKRSDAGMSTARPARLRVARMQARGESLAAIAELAGIKVGEVRGVLKAASAQPAARPDAAGAVIGASGGVETAVGPAAADAVGAARPEPLGVAKRYEQKCAGGAG